MDDVTYSPLSCVFGLVVFALVTYSKVFKLQKWFLKIFCGPFGISIFMNTDTCKGKIAYIRISPNPAKAGSHWVMLLLLF